MNKSIERFLKFNGQNVTILLKSGEWYVAIKPICTALGLNYSRQAQNIREHRMYSQLSANLHSVAADGKLRNMLCLPETMIYGWLANLNSDNEQLFEYQMKCHEILFSYFRGAMTERIVKLTERNDTLEKINECKTKLLESPEYKEILAAQSKIKQLDKSLKMMDTDLVNSQMTLNLDDNKTID